MKIGANRLSRTADHKKYFHVRADTRKRRNEEEEWRRDSGPIAIGPPEFCRGIGPPVKVASPIMLSSAQRTFNLDEVDRALNFEGQRHGNGRGDPGLRR